MEISGELNVTMFAELTGEEVASVSTITVGVRHLD
jgi:hypothetical protein